MDRAKLSRDVGVWETFERYERPIRAHNFQVCCLVVMFFMPAGASLDAGVYGWAAVGKFMPVRLLSALAVFGIWLALRKFTGRRAVQLLGLMVALPPVFSISWMIYATEGAASPYYAGLNLVMLGAAVLMRWNTIDSAIVVTLTLVSYLVATLSYGSPSNNLNLFFNNIYFLFVTGVIVVIGTWIYSRIRFSEFLMRTSLDQSRNDLQEANTKLADNYDKLRELDGVKNRFFANISHELRTPLTLLIAPLERLMHNTGDLTEMEEQDLLRTMQGNAMRLFKLINDLLDLARLESGRMAVKSQRLDVKEFLRGMIQAVNGVAHDKNIEIDLHVAEELDAVLTDPEKLERICLNLLFNAIKFTPAEGRIEITATREKDSLVIEVRDSGIGIEAEHLPHIFNRFWQADTASNRKFQGMGIGLSLVKELAEAMEGSVTATSKLGMGTTMTVRLPFVVADSSQLPEGTPPPSSGEDAWLVGLHRKAELHPLLVTHSSSVAVQKTTADPAKKPLLLICDDEPDMRHFLKIQLGAQFEVIEAGNGDEAVEVATRMLPDIILSDMMMPRKDGLQVCRELRAQEITRTIPVVLLTADTDSEVKINCLSAGASDFLTKPFSMPEVTVRLKNLVDARLYQKELAKQKLQLESALDQVKETETLLVRNEKLASLGRMSAGLIHEINNPLNYARQGLYLLKQSATSLPADERADFIETLKDVEEGVNRVVRIVSDLRSFTHVKNASKDMESFELKPVVDTTMRFFSHELKDGMTVEVNVPHGLEVRGDSNHLVQVLVNLVQNAIDALRTKSFDGEEVPHISITASSTSTSVFTTIRDNGPGVPSEIKNRIFDPFFTTKDVGSGMGLGLAICNRIMVNHGGRIDVRSETGLYSEFILEFPTTLATQQT